jgi:hypothetical protein
VALIPLDDPDVEPRSKWERWGAWLVVGACCLFVAHRVHLITIETYNTPLFPDIIPRFGSLVLRNTTTNGGDMGAHVYWPKFLAQEWFPNLRVQGWSPDWYSGFPIGQFYFPLPAVLIAMLDVVIPYNIAFKLVVVLGPIGLPAAAYYFGSKLRFPWPAPALFAIVAVRYLFEVRNGLDDAADKTGWTIYGGNLASTMAGEFSFTIALALALFFVGTLAVYLETGRRGWLPAVLLAGTVTSHIVVAAFAALVSLLVVITYLGRWIISARISAAPAWRKAWRISLPVAVIGFLLTATWSLPLVGAQSMTASMRYEKKANWGSFLFGLKAENIDGKWTSTGDWPRPLWLWILVAIAVFAAGWWRRSSTLVLLVSATTFGVLFVVWPEHHIWNTRFAPFYWLLLGFVAAVGAAELCRLVAYAWVGASDWIREGDRIDYLAALAAQRRALQGTDALHTGPEHRLEGEREDEHEDELESFLPPHLRDDDSAVQRRRHLTMAITIAVLASVMGGWSLIWTGNHQGVGDGWARWNFEGYEAKAGFDEYKVLMDTMGELEPGRALWETGHTTSGGEAFNNYGGALALELLPYWTDGRIGSMEGLYFESSATMPYHFLAVSRVAERPSNPVRGLDYGSLADFDKGVEQMRALGVRYYMAFNTATIDKAEANPDLHLVRTLGDLDGQEPKRWNIYEIENWALVAALPYEPIIAEVRGGTTAACFGSNPEARQFTLDDWECAAAPWWMTGDLDVPFAADGPAAWQHVDLDDLDRADRRALDPVEISDVVEGVDSISFTVDQIGVPVVVRTSYFPNWEASGAEGPWRISPNMMVVIPKAQHVELRYGLTQWDWLGRLGTITGLAGLVWLVRRPPRRRPWFSAPGFSAPGFSAPDDYADPAPWPPDPPASPDLEHAGTDDGVQSIPP